MNKIVYHFCLTALFTVITSIGFSQKKSLRVNIKNDFYNIQFRKVNQLGKNTVEYQLNSEAYGLTTCAAQVKGAMKDIDFGYFINGKEVSMEQFVKINPKESNYLFSCGKVGDSDTRLGVFLTSANKSNPLKSATTSEAIKQKNLFNKQVVVPSSTWKEINNNDRYFIDEKQVTAKKMRDDLKGGRVFVNKTWSLNQQDGNEWVEHYYYTTMQTYKNGMFSNSAPLEDIVEVVGKRERQPNIEIIQQKPENFSPVVKKQLEKEDGVRVIKKINGVQYIETYHRDGKITRQPLDRVDNDTIKDVKKEEKALAKEAKKIYPKNFKKLPQKRQQLLWDKMYSRFSVVYIDGQEFTGDKAKQYMRNKKKRIYKKFAEAAMHSKNNKNTFYIFTNRKEFELSGIKE